MKPQAAQAALRFVSFFAVKLAASIHSLNLLTAHLASSAELRTALTCAARLLALLLLLTLPAVVQAQFNYTTNNGTITITGYDCVSGSGALTIPSTINGVPVTSIGNSAFSYCGSLTSITIPNSVTNIGDGAFSYCNSVTNLTIPDSVTSIGNSAFYHCSSLMAITVDALNPAFASVDGVLFNRSQTALIQCPGGKAGSYTIPSIVTNIGSQAFSYCLSLTSITIPNSVTTIGDGAFDNCSGLTNVTIPNSVTSIGDVAFNSCTRLTSVTIGNNVTNIGGFAFAGCASLTGVYFKGNAPSVGSSVFNGANNASVYYLPGTTGWGTTFDGRPTALWVLPYPLILNNGPSFGVQTNRFGFIISWATNLSVVVEACADLANPIWSSVGTNTLTDGSSYFSDPQWTTHPIRFYRVISPVL